MGNGRNCGWVDFERITCKKAFFSNFSSPTRFNDFNKFGKYQEKYVRKPVSAKKMLELCFAVLHFTKYSVTNNLNGCSIVRIKGILQVSVILNVLWEPLNYLRMGPPIPMLQYIII